MVFSTLPEPHATRYALDDESDDDITPPNDSISIQVALEKGNNILDSCKCLLVGLDGGGYDVVSNISPKTEIAKLIISYNSDIISTGKLSLFIFFQNDIAILPIEQLVKTAKFHPVTVYPSTEKGNENISLLASSPARVTRLSHHISHAIARKLIPMFENIIILDSFQSHEYIGDTTSVIRLLSNIPSDTTTFSPPNLVTGLGAALFSCATRRGIPAKIYLVASTKSGQKIYTEPSITRNLISIIQDLVKLDENTIISTSIKKWDRIQQDNRLYM